MNEQEARAALVSTLLAYAALKAAEELTLLAAPLMAWIEETALAYREVLTQLALDLRPVMEAWEAMQEREARP